MHSNIHYEKFEVLEEFDCKQRPVSVYMCFVGKFNRLNWSRALLIALEFWELMKTTSDFYQYFYPGLNRDKYIRRICVYDVQMQMNCDSYV